MKKVNKSMLVPQGLDDYLQENPNDTWGDFRNNDQAAHKVVQNTLRSDQRGLCAYCEIDLARYHGVGHDDFRVEHFHPKKRPPEPPPNWDLEWHNLLAVCRGGSEKYLGDNSRSTSPDHSCDVPKNEQNLTGVILNPLEDIPAFPPIFEFDESGGMQVALNCPELLRDKAEKTIQYLHLDLRANVISHRLRRLRKAVIDNLRNQIMAELSMGKTEIEAASELAEIYFSSQQNSQWPAFFSCIRWYLGPSAEARLQAIDYNG
jgi:uncharacterized protein (TIGR02646 family)